MTICRELCQIYEGQDFWTCWQKQHYYLPILMPYKQEKDVAFISMGEVGRY